MTFDEEWAQLKAEAATRMNLAAAGDGGGSGDGDLKTSKAAWSRAATSIAELRGDLKKATVKLDDGQAGLGGSDNTVTGFVTGSAQTGVYQTWWRYLNLVGRECGEVAGKLRHVGNDLYKNDQAIREAFNQQVTKPEEPVPGGGHPSTGGR
ncbi:hypothetical protein OG292_28100 [Streptomyces sp. NBC_01511]|uniref:hypothetical protein n=1 Tax=Streptomyces sp. NBC_01511 TaxID=2903889 RepID=UPI0038696593